MNNLRYLYQSLRLIFVLFLVVGGGALFIYSWYYLYPFLIALLIAWALQPFIKLLEIRLLIPRTIAILILLLLLISLIGSIFTLVLAEVIKGIQILSRGIPGQFQQLINHLLEQTSKLITPLIERIEGIFGRMNGEQQQSISESFNLLKEEAGGKSADLISSIFEMITKGFAMIPSSLATLMIGTLAAFFICKDWDLIIDTTYKLIPDPVQIKTKEVYKDLKRTLAGIFKAQLILTAISMVIIYIGLSSMKVMNAFTITFASAFVDFIPYIGIGIIFIPWIVYQFLSGEFTMTIGLTSIYMLVIITRQFLEPKLLASHFGVPPIVLLIGLFIGFQVFGVYGMFLSPLIIALIKTFHNTGVTIYAWNFIKGTE